MKLNLNLYYEMAMKKDKKNVRLIIEMTDKEHMNLIDRALREGLSVEKYVMNLLEIDAEKELKAS